MEYYYMIYNANNQKNLCNSSWTLTNKKKIWSIWEITKKKKLNIKKINHKVISFFFTTKSWIFLIKAW